MAALVAQTPPRPGPGLYPQTPAPSRNALPAPSFGTSTRGALLPPQDRSQSQALTTIQQPETPATAPSVRPVESLKPVERAARSINTELFRVTQFPELDTYLSQGISCEYDLKSSPIWAPFQKVRVHNIPDQVFEQLNRAQISTSMGLFAELRYAWVAIDNALYLWDYTLNNPELLGYEDQPYSITAVKLAKPKQGVFTAAIKHMIVLATTEQIILLGLGQDPSAAPAAGLTLFQTGMTANVKGQVVTQIECSAKTGRVFFGGETNNDLHELTYQASESWFGSRCKDNNLTRSYNEAYNPVTKFFGASSTECVDQIVVDDTRDLVYTLSSKSSIRVFYMSQSGGMDLKITKEAKDTYANIGHIISPSDTLNPRIRLVSISPIPKDEAGRYHLVATTETGYRIYLSATTYGYGSSNASYPPQSMQALHVRTPPLVAANPGEAPPGPHQTNNYLRITTIAKRFPPGYFFCFTARDAKAPVSNLFVSAPDAARLSQPPEAGQAAKSTEPACWIQLNSKAEDIGVSVSYSPPSPEPRGFGSDISVQYDKPIPEIAILTNTGVHVMRRRRFVDSFSAMIRAGGGPEGFETEINNLIRSYGREEILSSALAVACGQGMEVSQERPTRINDPEVLEVARKIFIDYGGKPSIDQNKIIDKTLPPIDAVRPSHRHDAIARYISRIIRSCWRHAIAKEERSIAGYAITPAVPLDKLRAVQEDLVALSKFFAVNKSFIRGLSGPDDLGRQASKDDEIALQGEHRALHSLVKFVSDTIEGISFILVLFEEKVADIVPLLPEPSRPVFLQLTFEELFCTSKGHDLARDLVKAIVNRNIAKGSNVETIAEALRRKCGSFCSSDDVIIFKAQEQLKRAAEAKANAEFSRNLLNESLKLFEQVANSLPWDYLQSAVKDYIELQFFAGAVQLTLKVANELDKTNEALAWITEGRLDTDARRVKYDKRNKCYDLIHDILIALDKYVNSSPAFVDGRPTLSGQRRDEVFDVISRSKDEVFLTNLYDWYLSQGWQDKLLASDSTFIIVYLQRKSNEDLAHADLLWQYYTQQSQFQEAAKVQLGLARSSFPLNLSKRLEYLSRAKANASAFSTTNTLTRKAKQKLLSEINELLDIANIQDEILARLRSDPRHESPEKRSQVLSELDGAIKTISDLFNSYAERAAYYDICLLIYFIADHRDASLIKATWQHLFNDAHERAVTNNQLVDSNPTGDATGQIAAPYEHVAQTFRQTASRLRSSETIFPVSALVEMLERYALTQRADTADGRVHWVVDAFLDLDVPFEAIYDALETLYFTDSKPRDQRFFMADLLYVVERWLANSLKSGVVFGGEQGTARVSELVRYVAGAKGPGGRGDNDAVGQENRNKAAELIEVMSRLLA